MAAAALVLPLARRRRRPRVFNDRMSSLDHLTERGCGAVYRLDKAGITYLVDLLGDSLMRKYSRSKPVPPLTQGHLETNRVGVLLGDSGYALKPYLITPKLQPSSRQEEKYNEAHKDGRVVAERAFALLKSRFRCLHKSGGSLQFRPGKCEKIVVACARLHNMCVDRNIAEPDGQFINDIADDQIVPVFAGTAIDYRRNIINMF